MMKEYLNPGIVIASLEDTVFVTKNGHPVSDRGTILDTTFRKWSGSSRQLLPTNFRETIANAVSNISTSKILKMLVYHPLLHTMK